MNITPKRALSSCFFYVMFLLVGHKLVGAWLKTSYYLLPLDIQSYLLRFGFFGRFWWSKYLLRKWPWMSRVPYLRKIGDEIQPTSTFVGSRRVQSLILRVGKHI